MYEFTFRVSIFSNEVDDYYLDQEKDAQKVAKWFSDVNAWRVDKDDDLTFLSFEPVKNGRVYNMKCKFTMTDGKPLESEVKTMKEMLIDPDDDGNYPITLGGKKYLVMGSEEKI